MRKRRLRGEGIRTVWGGLIEMFKVIGRLIVCRCRRRFGEGGQIELGPHQAVRRVPPVASWEIKAVERLVRERRLLRRTRVSVVGRPT